MTIYHNLIVTYSNLDQTRDVTFDILPHKLAQKWATKVSIATKKYPIDQPDRFYCFDIAKESVEIVDTINKKIDRLNKLGHSVTRKLSSIDDQDTLNYLHHHFETGHGLLTVKIDNDDRTEVDQLLSELNDHIHHTEALKKGTGPRHSVTWYGLPKIDKLKSDDYSLFEERLQFGTVYLEYSDIGKDIECLAVDNDDHIGDNGFQPFQHYSADFHVQYFDEDQKDIEQRKKNIKEYYFNNQNYFEQRGYKWGDPRLTVGRIPLARLNTTQAFSFNSIRDLRFVKEVKVI